MCVECRVIVAEGERCDVRELHPVVSLADPQGCAHLAREVWDAPPLPHFVSPEAIVALGMLGSFLSIVGSLTLGPMVLLALPCAAVLSTIAYRAFQQKGGKVLPRGINAYLRLPARRAGRFTGTVRGESTLRAPMSNQPCLAYVATFRARDYYGGPILLVDAVTAEFDLESDDGRSIKVPAGRARLEVAAPQTIRGEAAIARYLRQFHPDVLRTERGRALPFDRAFEGLLRPGAQVELFARTTEVQTSYRDTAKLLVAEGVPRIRVL